MFLLPVENCAAKVISTNHAVLQTGDDESFTSQLRSDYQRFYAANNLKKMAGGLLVAGLLANTSMDEHFQHWFQVRVKTDSGDHFWNFFDRYGDKKRFLIRLAIFSGLAIFAKNTRFGKRARRYLPHYVGALAVGVPVLLLSESVLGSGRPMDGSSSHWHSFNSNQGVSGHAFIGAVGFITAAKLTKNTTVKCILYGLSVLPAIARVNSNHHYLSQVLLGWGLGYLSVNATFSSSKHHYKIMPVALPHGAGLAVVFI
jgi:membrane-associated phospholipid phosphatase